MDTTECETDLTEAIRLLDAAHDREHQLHRELDAERAARARVEAALRPFARWWNFHVSTPYNRYMQPNDVYPSHEEIKAAAAALDSGGE